MKAIVTDDSKATRMILCKLLADIGFEVEQAEDGQALLERLSDVTCDLCLIDWNMPGMDGTQVIRTLQAHPDWREIPAIIVTDETKRDRIAGALEAGAVGYLPKPFKSDELVRILQDAGVDIPQ